MCMSHLASVVDAVVHLLEEVPLPAALRVSDRRRVRRLRDQHVGTALVDPRRAQVPVGRHVVVALQGGKNKKAG